MLGNVWEWTQDWFHWSYVDAPTDGSAWENPVGDGRVFRTGCWYDTPETLFLFHRARTLPDAVDFCGGIRCAMDIPQPDGDVEEIEMETTEQDISDGETHAAITWVALPSGSFQMGCSPNDSHCYDFEKPVHAVNISAFQITETEITQGQYKSVMGNNPSHFSSCGLDCPVDSVPWLQAKNYCEKIGGRLLTEAEWEYAARGGTTTAYYCGDDGLCLDGIAWFYLNSDGKSHAVKTKIPNAFGLFDMSGNVWEWVEDCWHDDYTGAPTDGSVWQGGDCNKRILRGGSWGSGLDYGLRSSYRAVDETSHADIDDGFRCAKDF